MLIPVTENENDSYQMIHEPEWWWNGVIDQITNLQFHCHFDSTMIYYRT